MNEASEDRVIKLSAFANKYKMSKQSVNCNDKLYVQDPKYKYIY